MGTLPGTRAPRGPVQVPLAQPAVWWLWWLLAWCCSQGCQPGGLGSRGGRILFGDLQESCKHGLEVLPPTPVALGAGKTGVSLISTLAAFSVSPACASRGWARMENHFLRLANRHRYLWNDNLSWAFSPQPCSSPAVVSICGGTWLQTCPVCPGGCVGPGGTCLSPNLGAPVSMQHGPAPADRSPPALRGGGPGTVGEAGTVGVIELVASPRQRVYLPGAGGFLLCFSTGHIIRIPQINSCCFFEICGCCFNCLELRARHRILVL